MKILLLHDENNREIPDALFAMLQERGVRADMKPMGKNWNNDSSFLALLPHCTHLIIAGSFRESSWVSFCIGFALGAKSPVLVCGALPFSFGEKVFSDFSLVKDEKEFASFLDKGFGDWLAMDERQQAKKDLLDMGIPFNEESFERCIAEKDDCAVELFIKAGYSPNTLDKHGVPLLNIAARTGDRGAVKILIREGAEINRQAGDRGSSALIDACSGKSLNIVRDLIAAGADVNLKSKDGQSALIIAVGLNEEGIVEELLKAGADADVPDALGASARKYAGLFNKPAIVSLFARYAPLGKQ